MGRREAATRHEEPREWTAEQAIFTVEQPASSHILMRCMTAWPGKVEQTETAARTAALGRFLNECTSHVTRLSGLIRTQARRGQELRIGSGEDALASRAVKPDDWADYLRLLLRSALKSLKNPSFLPPCDIEGPASYDMQEVQSRIRAWGELLMQWLATAGRGERRPSQGQRADRPRFWLPPSWGTLPA